MKKLFFAFVIGACAVFALPSCGEKAATSGSNNDTTAAVTAEKAEAEAPAEAAAIDKLAEMQVTKENAAEYVTTFGAAVDEALKAVEAKDAAKVKTYAEKFETLLGGLETKADMFTPEQQQAIKAKFDAFMEAYATSGLVTE